MLKNHNSEMTEASIRAMSHEQLIEAVIRMLNVPYENAATWHGQICVPDNLCDAFRNKK